MSGYVRRVKENLATRLFWLEETTRRCYITGLAGATESASCSFASAERLLLHAGKLLLCCDAPCTGPAGVPSCSDGRDKLYALAGQLAGTLRGLHCGRKSFGGAWATAGVRRNGFCHRSVVKPTSFVYALQPRSYSPSPSLTCPQGCTWALL